MLHIMTCICLSSDEQLPIPSGCFCPHPPIHLVFACCRTTAPLTPPLPASLVHFSSISPPFLPCPLQAEEGLRVSRDWWTGPFPRVLSVFRGKYKSISADFLRLECCPPPPTTSKSGAKVRGGSPFSGRWMWIGHCVFVGWRVAAQFAGTVEGAVLYWGVSKI